MLYWFRVWELKDPDHQMCIKALTSRHARNLATLEWGCGAYNICAKDIFYS